MTQTIERPERTEAVDYYFTYIDKVPAGDIRAILDTQGRDVVAELRAISDETSLRRYAPDKWSIREVVSHLNDAERAFTFRAFWFARGLDSALPSFDQDVAVRGANDISPVWLRGAQAKGNCSAIRWSIDGAQTSVTSWIRAVKAGESEERLTDICLKLSKR